MVLVGMALPSFPNPPTPSNTPSATGLKKCESSPPLMCIWQGNGKVSNGCVVGAVTWLAWWDAVWHTSHIVDSADDIEIHQGFDYGHAPRPLLPDRREKNAQ